MSEMSMTESVVYVIIISNCSETYCNTIKETDNK